MTSVCLPPLPDEPVVQVVARWRTGVASCEEIQALRRVLPDLREMPIADVFRQARSVSEWVLATCQPREAWQHREPAEQAGLVVVIQPAPERQYTIVPDEEVIEELTAGGQAVTDYFLVGGLVCSGDLVAMIIEDADLSRATSEYLRRIGASEYSSYEEFRGNCLPERGEGTL
jgi:hypothetical protein